MARRSPPRKVTHFEPVPPRLARNTIIESTFEVGRRFSCTMRVEYAIVEKNQNQQRKHVVRVVERASIQGN